MNTTTWNKNSFFPWDFRSQVYKCEMFAPGGKTQTIIPFKWIPLIFEYDLPDIIIHNKKAPSIHCFSLSKIKDDEFYKVHNASK